MAVTKTAKVEADIVKVRAKMTELGIKLKELENKKLAMQNAEIVDIVRGINIPLDELATLLQSVRSGEALPAAFTSGQNVQKSTPEEYDSEEDNA